MYENEISEKTILKKVQSCKGTEDMGKNEIGFWIAADKR